MEGSDAEDAAPSAPPPASRSSTTKPSWNKPVLALGPRLLEQAVGERRHRRVTVARRADEHLLHDAGDEVPVGVVDRAPHQAAVAGDGERLLGVEVPAVEADRAVEPERVVEAEAGEPCAGCDALRVRAERHVEQEVVAGVREQRGVQHRVVADGARETHPVRAGALRRTGRRGRSGPRRCAARAAAAARPSSGACARSSGGRSRTQSCSTGSSSGRGTERRRVGELGARRVGVERGDRDQERALALRDGHSPRRDRAAVAHPVDRAARAAARGCRPRRSTRAASAGPCP